MVNGSARDETRVAETSSQSQNQIFFAIVRVEPEARHASRQKPLARAPLCETQLEEDFVLVWPRDGVNRRKREQPEPALHVGWKMARAFPRHAVHPASKPFGSETKSDSRAQPCI
jgi:hypothetical protein